MITGWTPHWMWFAYDLKLLEDPEKGYGEEENIRGIHTKIQRLSPLSGGTTYGRDDDSALFCDRRIIKGSAPMALIATTKSIGYACENGLMLRSRKPYIVTKARIKLFMR